MPPKLKAYNYSYLGNKLAAWHYKVYPFILKYLFVVWKNISALAFIAFYNRWLYLCFESKTQDVVSFFYFSKLPISFVEKYLRGAVGWSFEFKMKLSESSSLKLLWIVFISCNHKNKTVLGINKLLKRVDGDTNSSINWKNLPI